MSSNREESTRKSDSMVGYGEYDAETVERVHQENIRKSRNAVEQSSGAPSEEIVTTSKQYTWKSRPRKVEDHEISSYQGTGGRKQMLRAQSRKRRQVRRQEASIWDNLAPKEVHGILNFMLTIIFILGLVLAFFLSGHL